jgi:hypothetical protein
MGAKAFHAVAALLAGIDAHNTARVTRGQGGRQLRTARESLVEQLTAIARSARVVSAAVGGSDSMFHAPGRLPDVTLLATARAVLQRSRGAVDPLLALGLPETFVADLQEAIDRFDRALSVRRNNRAGVAAAVQGIKTAFTHAHGACRVLDVVIGNTLKKDPVLFAAWERDRRVKTRRRVAAAVTPPVNVVSLDDAVRKAS